MDLAAEEADIGAEKGNVLWLSGLKPSTVHSPKASRICQSVVIQKLKPLTTD